MRPYCFLFLIFSCAYAGDEVVVVQQVQAANASIARGAYGDAIQQLLLALRGARRSGARPAMGIILNDLGYAYRVTGRCQDAIDILGSAVRIQGDSPNARVSAVNLLASYLDCGQSARAERYWERNGKPRAAASTDEGAAALWAAGATVEAVRKHYADSEALYTKAISMWDHDPGRRLNLVLAHTSRGVERAYLGRLDDARADAADTRDVVAVLARADPGTRSSALNNMGVVALIDGRLEDAAGKFAEARAILDGCSNCSSMPVILANYAECLRKMGKSRAARQARREAGEAARLRGRESRGESVDISTFGAFPR